MQKTVNRYATTHPLPPERIQATENYLRHSKQPAAFPVKIEADFQRLKAKFTGFLSPPTQVLKLYPEKDLSQAAQYARAIAYYRQGYHDKALACMDTLLKVAPTDAYFYELKGQILFDAGKTMAAITCLKTALRIVKKSPLIEILLAQALLESGRKEHIAEAMKRLVPLSQQKEPNIFIWRLMAIVYGHQNNPGMVCLCLAEEAVLKKEFSFARIQVLKAKKYLAPTSPGFLRANDLLRYMTNQ